MSRVLCVRLDNAGDVLLAGPAIRAVAAGADHVTLLAGPNGAGAARLLPGVDAVRTWRAPWIDPEPEAVDREDVLALADALGAERYDRALIFGSFHQSPLPTALVLRLAGVPWIGATSVDYPGSLLDLRHQISDDVHEVERALGLARAAGYDLPEGDGDRLRVTVEAPAPAGHVVVHPGASVPARAWAPARMAALVQALAARGERVLVTGAPAERTLTGVVAGPGAVRGADAQAVAAALLRGEAPLAAGQVADLGGATDLPGLAGLLGAVDAVVVGNTGPAHLAAAMGAPVVSLFAPTVPAVRWRPWGVPLELLHVPVPCAGCRARTCPVPGHPCVDDVTPEDVLGALERVRRTAVIA